MIAIVSSNGSPTRPLRVQGFLQVNLDLTQTAEIYVRPAGAGRAAAGAGDQLARPVVLSTDEVVLDGETAPLERWRRGTCRGLRPPPGHRGEEIFRPTVKGMSAWRAS